MKQLLTSILGRLRSLQTPALTPTPPTDADDARDKAIAAVTAPLERVLGRNDLTSEVRSDVEKALRNARRLYRLQKDDREQRRPVVLDVKPSEVTVSSIDEELVRHVIAHIEAHMQDTDYSVTQLSSAVGMTRGHLYKKMMAITGKSPLDIIRTIKTARGKSLLDQGRTNISEVSRMVGLSAKQFTNYFKEAYHTTPSEYLRHLNDATRQQMANADNSMLAIGPTQQSL